MDQCSEYAKGLKYYKESEQVKELQEKAVANRKRELADQEMRDRVSAEVAKYEREAEKQAEFERLRLLEEKHRLKGHRKELLLQKYGPEIGTRLSNYELWIGMTREMLVDSWGKPLDINRTVTASRVSEQFVYGSGRYVYVDNGIVTAWQD